MNRSRHRTVGGRPDASTILDLWSSDISPTALNPQAGEVQCLGEMPWFQPGDCGLARRTSLGMRRKQVNAPITDYSKANGKKRFTARPMAKSWPARTGNSDQR
jgi:hypothetical protein